MAMFKVTMQKSAVQKIPPPSVPKPRSEDATVMLAVLLGIPPAMICTGWLPAAIAIGTAAFT